MPSYNDPAYENSRKLGDVVLFAMVFILFILSWISVAVVGRALDNFTFSTLKLDSRSTFQTTVIAVTVVLIELSMIQYLNNIGVSIYDSSIMNSNCEEHTNKSGPISMISQLYDIEIM